MKRIIALLTICGVLACSPLMPVVNEIANISQQVIADIEKGMQAPAIIDDIVATDSAATLELIISIVDSLLASPKVSPSDVPMLNAVKDHAVSQKAARDAMKAH